MTRQSSTAWRKAARWAWPLLLVGRVSASMAMAQPAGLPATAEVSATRSDAAASFALAVGSWGAGGLPARELEGHLTLAAWQVPDAVHGTLGLLQPLRAGLADAGWQILFECSTAACGGFDFRYALEVLPEPAMHVDLGDFRYLAAQRAVASDAPEPTFEYQAVLVSRAAIADTGFIQIARITPGTPAMPDPAVAMPDSIAPKTSDADATATLAAQLEHGVVVLEGVEFSSGAATTSGGDEILAALAAYLAAHPDRSIALVGHTDMTGGLEVNLALSQRRANAVRDRMIREYGASPAQISALGAGVMAPRASNLTPEGQARNRRVEAILTSTR